MTFKDGDIIRYRPASSHARHGLAHVHVNEHGISACDTYWSFPTQAGEQYGWLYSDDIEKAKLIGNISDFEKRTDREPSDYLPEDVIYIPMGGWHAQHWYRLGAQPDPERVRDRLACAVEQAESAIRHAQWKKERAEKELAEHNAKFAPTPEKPQQESEER